MVGALAVAVPTGCQLFPDLPFTSTWAVTSSTQWEESRMGFP